MMPQIYKLPDEGIVSTTGIAAGLNHRGIAELSGGPSPDALLAKELAFPPQLLLQVLLFTT